MAVLHPPVSGRRPAPVTAAAVLLAAMGTIGLGYGLAGLAVAPGAVRRYRAAGGTDVAALWIGGALSAVLGLLLFGVLVGVAVGLWRGRPAARVVAWIVSGLGVLCGGAAALVVGLGPGGSPTDLYPAAWVWLNVVLCVGQSIGYIVAAVLLVAGSGDFFRRPRLPDPRPWGAGPPGAGPPGVGPPGVGPPGYGWAPQSR